MKKGILGSSGIGLVAPVIGDPLVGSTPTLVFPNN